MSLWLARHTFKIVMLLIVVIGWLDYLTGPDIGFSLFYLVPIAVVSWQSGRWYGVIAAVTAATFWLFAEVAWNKPWAISLWNGFTRLMIYSTTAWLIARVQRDRFEMEDLNTNLKQALAREEEFARIDPTTGLPNPRAFLEHLRSDLSNFAQAHCSATLLFLDLDNFKTVNDEYGHSAGDEVLTRIASGLQRQIRGADMAARIGGDEFVVLVWHPDSDDAGRVQEAIEAVVDEVASSYPRARLGVSIGSARIDDTLQDPEDIIRTADHAMYEVKARRKASAPPC